MNSRMVVAGVAVAAALALAGGRGSAKIRDAGDTATKAEVVRGLESTGYEFRYRRPPVVPGYDFVMGRARSKRGGVVDFVVVIRKAGPSSICEAPPESDCHQNPAGPRRSPEPPLVRYDYEALSTWAGNLRVWSREQSPERKGRHYFTADPEETRMVVKLDVAATRAIAPPYQEGI
jgi:hypothetical protein